MKMRSKFLNTPSGGLLKGPRPGPKNCCGLRALGPGPLHAPILRPAGTGPHRCDIVEPIRSQRGKVGDAKPENTVYRIAVNGV